MNIDILPEIFFFFVDGQVFDGEFTPETIRANGVDDEEVVKNVIKTLMLMVKESEDEIDIAKIIKELK